MMKINTFRGDLTNISTKNGPPDIIIMPAEAKSLRSFLQPLQETCQCICTVSTVFLVLLHETMFPGLRFSAACSDFVFKIKYNVYGIRLSEHTFFLQ